MGLNRYCALYSSTARLRNDADAFTPLHHDCGHAEGRSVTEEGAKPESNPRTSGAGDGSVFCVSLFGPQVWTPCARQVLGLGSTPLCDFGMIA